jgi:ATP-dependent Clp protease ATP-binding subunit ClpA
MTETQPKAKAELSDQEKVEAKMKKHLADIKKFIKEEFKKRRLEKAAHDSIQAREFETIVNLKITDLNTVFTPQELRSLRMSNDYNDVFGNDIAEVKYSTLPVSFGWKIEYEVVLEESGATTIVPWNTVG